VVENAPLEQSQLRAGVEPELVSEHLLTGPVGRERIGRPVAAVEREHQLCEQPFAVRVLAHERLELADERAVAAEGEVGLDPVLERRQAGVGDAGDLRPGERLVGEVGERVAAPQSQCRAEELARARRVAICKPLSRFFDQRLEPLAVDLSGRRQEHVAAAARLQHIAAERLAQVRDVDLDRLRRRRRWPLAPELVDQAIARDDFAAMQQQDC
jgi:hypothetical protein